MIKPIKYDDVFGYDNKGTACAIQLAPKVFGFGYDFCRQIKPLLKSGCPVAHRLLADGTAFIFIYEPTSKTVELWEGPWEENRTRTFSIVNPECAGLLESKFEDFGSLKIFAKSDISALAVSPGAIPRE